MTQTLLTLASSDLREIATAIRAQRLSLPFSVVSLQRIVPGAIVEAVAAELQMLADVSGGADAVAGMLELVVKDRVKRPMVEDVIDVVTTGPEASGVTNRDTSVVVRELFTNARHSVLVAGYAVYQGQRVFGALADRMQEVPKLNVRMFLDVARGPGDTSTISELVLRFASRFKTDQWPEGRPLPEVFFFPRSLATDGEKRSSLHAKCIVIDRAVAFVSSANFTEAAQERNIEVGLLIHSPLIAEKLERHFESLVAEGLLSPLPL